MAKYCPNCGNEVLENSNFCTKCGTNLNTGETKENNYNNSNPDITLPNRNIVTCLILSFITCGIYSIYWFIVMTDEANMISDDKGPTGGMAFLFTILTCGIYGIYWNYKMGQRLYQAGHKYNKPIGDSSVIYLVLSIFQLSIVSYALIQSDLNKFAKEW
ncbi:MAG TPA: DUF4234 domain-containing protein [Candidatus Onthocola stercorigallinarum]|nr:DUF4234 domain-containing protein [Candidatus Onthocola stercorigallinarum]